MLLCIFVVYVRMFSRSVWLFCVLQTESPRGGTPEGDSKAENGSTNGGSVLRQRKKGTVEERSKNEGEQSSQEEDGDNEEKEEAVDDEEEEWSKIQKDMKKNKSSPFTEKSTDSHPVHCPNFPLVGYVQYFTNPCSYISRCGCLYKYTIQ